VIAAGEVEEQGLKLNGALVSEVFHNLSQPLTALHCELELALRRDRTVEELRASVQSALEDAERLRQRLLLVRALSDASEPGDLSQPTDLCELFRQLHEDLLPLFASAGQKFELELECGVVRVRANQARLTSALFAFLEYLFRHSAEGAVLTIGVRVLGGGQAEIRISAATCLPVAPSADGSVSTPYSCEIEMARRSFRAVDGEFALVSAGDDESVWRATLPLA
jgi:signal transduction histidine kinase